MCKVECTPNNRYGINAAGNQRSDRSHPTAACPYFMHRITIREYVEDYLCVSKVHLNILYWFWITDGNEIQRTKDR